MEDDKATPLEGNNSAEVVASNYPTTKDSRRNGSEVAEDSVKSLCENFEEKLSIPGTDKGIGSEEESKSPEDMNENCENPSNPLLLEEPEKIMKDQQTQSTTSWDSNYDSYDPELEEILHYSKLADAMNEANADEESNSTNSAPLQIARSGTLPWASSSTRLYKKIKKQYLFGRRNPKKLTSTTVFGLFPSQSVRHEILLPDNPPHPTIDKIRAQHINEKKCKARQQAMITQQATLQKLKDAERVRGWRQAYTEQQKAKLLEYLSKTQRDIREEADKRAVAAPFDVGREHLKMIGTAELNALRNRCIRSATPPPNLSAQMVLELEMASFERDRRLTEKVQRHLADVGGRFQIPMPNSREALYTEMLTAKRDLDLALRLHHRVKLRLETLEHFRGSNRRDLWS
ncbi:hypothetical protein D915_004983 [Fasciola hepatica]|uniref:Uncharacterized protein n=1 Tax=Fasciola hepatica TaxID=6192 RepID=A0A4E0RDL6_FASHE|nr:hypothetical protein D915_004983 [Fasciola hepatica]